MLDAPTESVSCVAWWIMWGRREKTSKILQEEQNIADESFIVQSTTRILLDRRIDWIRKHVVMRKCDTTTIRVMESNFHIRFLRH